MRIIYAAVSVLFLSNVVVCKNDSKSESKIVFPDSLENTETNDKVRMIINF